MKLNNFQCLPFRAGILLLATLVLMACGTSAHSNAYRVSISPDDLKSSRYMKLNLLGSLGISSSKVNGIPVVELSDLAWDNNTQTLYGVSDDGYLYTMKIRTGNNKLLGARFNNAVKLLGPDRKTLRGANNDPEGLDLVYRNNKAELIISFEGNSRIARYSTSGDYLGDVKLPAKLGNKANYQHQNKTLESVVIHPRFGILTATELPLKIHSRNVQSVYAQNGKEWHFPRYKAAESSITALEVLPNGDLLVLERAFSGIFQPLVISLRQVQLNRCDRNSHCQVKDIAVFSSADGWTMDNFEGLTHLSGNRYLMASDDNKSPIQQTLLVMFDILP